MNSYEQLTTAGCKINASDVDKVIEQAIVSCAISHMFVDDDMDRFVGVMKNILRKHGEYFSVTETTVSFFNEQVSVWFDRLVHNGKLNYGLRYKRVYI